MKKVLDDLSSELHIVSTKKIKHQVVEEMKYNDKPNKQSFSGIRQAEKVMYVFMERELFVYAYLLSKCIDSGNSTGIIKYHLLYDADEHDNGETVPVT